jgi:hypothetical protein
MNLDDEPDLPTLDYGTIRGELDTLIQAFANKLDREWPDRWRDHPGSSVLLEALVRANFNTFRSIRFLCADGDDGGRRPEFALSAGPLNRTILDSLFTVVFALENLPARSTWYFRSGWREIREEHDRTRERYGSDRNWAGWLTGHATMVKTLQEQLGISEAEAENPRLIKWWPTPGQMKNDSGTSQDRRDYLSYLNDWFYKQLSAESHMTWPGLVMRSAPLMPRSEAAGHKWKLEKQRSDNFGVAVVLMLTLLSEIELELRYGLDARLKYVWGVLNSYYGMAKELYEHRYVGRL